MEGLLRKGYSGGEELRRAMAALAGPSTAKAAEQRESTDSGPHPVPLPIQLKEGTEPGAWELAYAAQRYGKAAQRDPSDFEAVYNQGLALQELALRASVSRQEQLQLLQQAAERYEAAWKLRQSSHAALYNWGVALSDMARIAKPADSGQAYRFLEESASKYAMSLEWNPNNPQALNNWGLVLQELSTMQPPAQQAALVRQSISRFRRAIRLRPDFDRACYNLGTVYYGFACTQQSSLTQQLPSRLTQDPERIESERERETEMTQLFGLAAQYILLAHALQPGKEVYRKSLPVVQPLLPLPFLRAGLLKAPQPGTEHSFRERWEERWFVLDESSFRSHAPPATEAPDSASTSGAPSHSSISLVDIATARTCLDPSLPAGSAFWVGLNSRPSGVYFVAGKAEEAEGWVDALQLTAHIASLKQQQQTGLRQALNPAPPPAEQPPRPKTREPSGRRGRNK